MPRPRLPLGAHGDIWLVPETDKDGNETGRVIARAMLRTHTGKRRQLQRIGDSPTKAKNALQTALTAYVEDNSTGTVKATTTLDKLGETYLESVKGLNRSPVTVAEYARILRLHVSKIGDMRVSEAEPSKLYAFLEQLRDDHGPGAVKTARSILNGMFDLAVKHGALNKNPAREVNLTAPTVRGKRGATPIPPARIGELESALRASPVLKEYDLTDLFLVLLGCGLRVGEACALQWADWHPEECTLTVGGTNRRLKGEGVQRQPYTKSDSGDRELVVPNFVADALNARDQVAQEIFQAYTGGLLDPIFVEQKLRDVRDDLGFPGLTTHSFRKTVATLLDDAGLSARQIADYLGHSDPSMTLAVYLARKESTATAADLLSQRFA